MSPFHQYHYALRRFAIVLAVVNFASRFALDLREWLVYFDPQVVRDVVWPSFAIALPSLPYLLPLSKRTAASVAAALPLALVTLLFCFFEALWFFMIAIATFCRGPNWTFYWPWEERVPKLVPLNSVNLSEWVWIYFCERPPPHNPFIREWVGIAALLVYLFIVPLAACCLLRRFTVQTPFWRMLTFLVLVQLLAAFPIKMLLQWLFNLKYVIAFPEYFLNF